MEKFLGWTKATEGLEALASNDDAAIAVAQHYGFATHFIDFTTEPSVAGYFASEGIPQQNEIGYVDLASPFARAPLETIGIEKAHEQLEVGIIAVVRRWRHEHEMPRAAPSELPELVAFGVLHLGAEHARRHAMSFHRRRRGPSRGRPAAWPAASQIAPPCRDA